LPAEVELIAEPVAQLTNVDDTCEFGLYSSKNNKPHLAGVVTLKSDSK